MILVNFFYAQPVGHAVEALHYANGHHAADPTREISVALNAATAVELAELCPFVEHAYAIDHPFVEPALYPSLAAWRSILDALHAAHPELRPALIGRTTRDRRTASALDRRELLDHPSKPLDAYDLPLKDQLAIVKASELFLSPHTG